MIWGLVCVGLPVALVALFALFVWQFSRRQARLMHDGQTVVARVLFAHPCLYDAEDSSTFSGAFVVFTMDDDASERHLAELAEICERLDGFRARRNGDEDEQTIGKALTRQITVGQIPLLIPDRIARGKAVYFSTPAVMRRMLPEGRLVRDYIYLKVLIDGDYRDLAMIEYPEEGVQRQGASDGRHNDSRRRSSAEIVDEGDEHDNDWPHPVRAQRSRPKPSGMPVWGWVAIAVGAGLLIVAVVTLAARGGRKEDQARAPAAAQGQPGQPQRGQPVAPPAAPPPDLPSPTMIPFGKEPFILGSIGDPMFKTIGSPGAVLIGVEARFEKFGSTDIVRAVRPIYRVGGKEERGRQFGDDLTGAVTLKAKPGYAVGGMAGKAGWWCHGFSFTYMRVKPDGTLDPADIYESGWAGWDGPIPVIRTVGGGAPAVGIVGKIAGPKTTALGMVFKGQEAPDADAEKPVGTAPPGVAPMEAKPVIIAGGGHPAFKDMAPGGGVLVGLELALGQFFGKDVIKAVRPIYRVGEAERPGVFRGTSRQRLTVIKAKPGYAVGGLACKSGANFDGMALTFMRIKADGTLDPADAYESEWVGWVGDKPLQKVGGDGTPAVGVVGRASAAELNGFGLLFRGQERYDPTR